MLDSHTIAIIKATVPVLQIHAPLITETFYPLLFAKHPDVIPYFNQTNQSKGTQSKALANAVIAYGANIDALGNLSEAVTKIVHKHTSLGIMPCQYEAVGQCLLEAIKRVLGDAATDEIITAWHKAYTQLASLLIDAEEAIYHNNQNKEGGWRGERDFTLVKRVDESAIITSFYFKPSDSQPLPHFEPGQFTTIIFDNIDGINIRRNYSLSNAPGQDYFRISVKRELQGIVSNYLHDKMIIGECVKFTMPAGGFILQDNRKPIVFLTGGVGITPAISMLDSAANSGRDIHFIHAAIDSTTHAFKQHVAQHVAQNEQLTSCTVYSDPTEQCQPDAIGFITKELIQKQLNGKKDVEFYLLGPIPFMRVALDIATNIGIPASQIHYEFFGPSQSITA